MHPAQCPSGGPFCHLGSPDSTEPAGHVVLADPARLAIVRQLAADVETCACDFTATCDVAQPTVSHHLRVPREGGIVTSERRGQWIFYRRSPDAGDRFGPIARSLVPGRLVTDSASASDKLAQRTAGRLV